MPDDFNTIPLNAETRRRLKAYVVDGEPPTTFLRALLVNDLRAACREACRPRQPINERDIVPIVLAMEQVLPSACWGSESAVREWLRYKESLRHTNPLFTDAQQLT